MELSVLYSRAPSLRTASLELCSVVADHSGRWLVSGAAGVLAF